mgnify:CR=1 FL=1
MLTRLLQKIKEELNQPFIAYGVLLAMSFLAFSMSSRPMNHATRSLLPSLPGPGTQREQPYTQ